MNNRNNDKNKKFIPLNINNVFKGKSVQDSQNKSGYRVAGMQNIGKVSSMRRVPAPKWVPSIKAETGASENRQIINQSSSGWVSSSNQDGYDQAMMRNQSLNKDKNQWISKATHNKPFFLMGQEFPSLPTDATSDTVIDPDKDGYKSKDSESVKSKLDDLRNRDNTISASTLNRIDALSISKNSKGDIAATGWAAEDEEPNFDEKIVFSDDESINENQNWPSDSENVNKSDINAARMAQNQMREPQISMGDTWFEQSQLSHYSQYPQFQMQMNMPNQYIPNQQFPPNIINRSSASSVINPAEDQTLFLNTVAEQRNARNMEYYMAIERARQKKMGAHINRPYSGYHEELMQHDQMSARSRHTSVTSDTNESMNTSIEMGPPGGPPMIHSHPHKPHISPMMHNTSLPIISPTLAGPSSMIRFTQPPFMMPIQTVSLEHITDPKLMEKWVEFLKQQQANNEGHCEVPMTSEHQQQQLQQQQNQQQIHQQQIHQQQMHQQQLPPSRQVINRDVKLVQEDIQEPEPTKSQPFSANEHNLEREREEIIEKKSESTDILQKDQTRKHKSLYSTDGNSKNESTKRISKNKYGSNTKDFRSNKYNYKDDYGSTVSGENKEYMESFRGNNEDVAYEDYHVYQQHYSERRKGQGYKGQSSSDFRQTANYQYYDEPYSKDSSDYNNSRPTQNKFKTTKAKDYNKISGPQMDQFDHGTNSIAKKVTQDNQEFQTLDKECFEGVERKNTKDIRKGIQKSGPSSYSNKRYDNYGSYKDRPVESRQEYSMGFAVNPKDSQRNYYSSSYNRRVYHPDYMYYSYPPNSDMKYGDYDNSNNYYHHHSSDKYSSSYQDHYEQDPYQYPKSTKRAPKVATDQQWRKKDGEKTMNSKSKVDGSTGPSKPLAICSSSNGRGGGPTNRRGDKRQQSSSMPKESNNDIDQEEWETASEGGSARSNSAPRDNSHRSMISKYHVDHKVNDADGEKRATKTESQKSSEEKFVTGNCGTGSWPSYPDDDESDGATGTAGRSNVANQRHVLSHSKSTDSTQSKTTDNGSSSSKSHSNNSTSKECSNNNGVIKDLPKSFERNHHTRAYLDFLEISKSSSIVNTDKLPEVTEDEELLYENVEQFQEVLSKSAKKNRKLEEQRRLKEETEQKRLESLKLNNIADAAAAKAAKKPLAKKELHLKTSSVSQEKMENVAFRKSDIKPVTTINRDKDSFKKYECTKVAMQIGSWDNSLADDINLDKRAPPKPIGTPASSSSWNAKVKSKPPNTATVNSSTVGRAMPISVKEDSKSQVGETKCAQSSQTVYLVSSDATDGDYNTSMSYNYKKSMFDRTNDEKKVKETLESKSVEVTMSDPINFEYDVKSISCDTSKRNPLTDERILSKNDQQSLNDKINSVKNIWDNLQVGATTSESDPPNNSRAVAAAVNADIDINRTTTCNDHTQDNVTVSRNVDVNLSTTPALSINNVCKVKPQLQHDFIKKDYNEQLISSSAFAIRNSPATFLSQNQPNFMPYTSHQFPQELFQDHLHASDALATLLSNNQTGMHINYNLANPHLLDSSLLRQNHQDHMLNNKMNFISQSSFYPQQTVTPKLFSNASGQLPLNMDMSSSHGALPLQHLLLTRQNSLTSIMQSNGMSIPFIQSGQQHAQTPLFPTTPLLGPTNFSSQLNPFPQGHYSPGSFPSLHHNPQFPQNQQILLNQQHQQQLLQSQMSHDRVMNSGQSGIYNSILGSSDMSTNAAAVSDFNNQHHHNHQKHLNHNNIIHGVNGSTIMLPHNLNILMKPHLFTHTSSQYNGFQAPIQSSQINVRNGYENHCNMKVTSEMDGFKSSDKSMVDRGGYNIDNYTLLPKQRDDFYVDHNDFENCDMAGEGWTANLRQTNVNNFIQQTLDFQSQRSPLQFPLDTNISCPDNIYRNFLTNLRENNASFPSAAHNNLQLTALHRNKPHSLSNDHTRHYPSNKIQDPSTFASNQSFNSTKGDGGLGGGGKMCYQKSGCESMSANDSGDTFIKDNAHSEKSFSFKSKNESVHRSSFSESFEDKTQSWSVMEDDGGECIKVSKTKIGSGVIDGGDGGGGNTGGTQGVATVAKMFSNPSSKVAMFDSQCQYGYDETQLSSQTAECLSKFDPSQMKKMIMKLREGPVMTFADFDSSYEQLNKVRNNNMSSSLKSSKSSWSGSGKQCYNYVEGGGGTECAGMGFYTRNRALTPPARNNSTNNNNYKTGTTSHRTGRYQQNSSTSSCISTSGNQRTSKYTATSVQQKNTTSSAPGSGPSTNNTGTGPSVGISSTSESPGGDQDLTPTMSTTTVTGKSRDCVPEDIQVDDVVMVIDTNLVL